VPDFFVIPFVVVNISVTKQGYRLRLAVSAKIDHYPTTKIHPHARS